MDKVEAFLTKIEDEQSDAIDRADNPSLYMGDANKLIDLVRVYREANQFYADGENYIRVTLAEEGGGMGQVKYSLIAIPQKDFKDLPQAKARSAEAKAEEIVG